jgi:hypothetical protein
MNLALQSNCTDMALDLSFGSFSLGLFQHKLFQQVTSLRIMPC